MKLIMMSEASDSIMNQIDKGGGETMNTGLKIKIARVSADRKQHEVAQEVGISSQYLRQLESGKASNPSREVMEKLAKTLNLSVQYLFFNNEN